MELRQSFSHSISQNYRLEQRLVSLIEFSGLLAVPDAVYEIVEGAVAYNPESVEGILKEKSEQLHPSDQAGRVQSIYGSIDPGNSGGSSSGKILTPDIRFLEGKLPSYNAHITPDVTYIGREGEKPELVFSDHLKGKMELKLELDHVKYPHTAKLVKRLRTFDDWKRKELRKIYSELGSVQREFFANFDSFSYNLCGQGKLAEIVGLHESTVSRILANRWIEARNVKGDVKVMNTKDLCTTINDIKRLRACQQLNEVLQEEWESKRAYSDQELTNRIENVARRTVNKYRKAAGIPDKHARNLAYNQGIEAFRINF